MPGKPKDTTDPAAPPADDTTAGTEIDQRFTAIENEQAEQRGILDKVLAAVTPGAPSASGAAGSTGQDLASPGVQLADVQQQVRDEIKAADERRRKEESEAAWRAGVTEVVETVKAERAPREPVSGFRGRLQSLIIGKPE